MKMASSIPIHVLSLSFDYLLLHKQLIEHPLHQISNDSIELNQTQNCIPALNLLHAVGASSCQSGAGYLRILSGSLDIV